MAAIGDVHAEDERLERALRAASALNVDLIACTGDIVDGGGSVARCCALLRQHEVACVRGNHDRWLFSGLLRDARGATRLADVNADDQQFLKGLPATREIQTQHGLVMLCHGIGDSDLEKITSYTTEYSLQSNTRLNAVRERGYRVLVNGHSHERLVVRAGGLVIVNAGTLSHPDDPGFVLLDFAGNVLQWHSIIRDDVSEASAIF